MTNNRQKSTQKTDLKKLAGLQQLKLEQLDGVVGSVPRSQDVTRSQDQTEVA